jgi:hypothetical protein
MLYRKGTEADPLPSRRYRDDDEKAGLEGHAGVDGIDREGAGEVTGNVDLRGH